MVCLETDDDVVIPGTPLTESIEPEDPGKFIAIIIATLPRQIDV